MFSNIIQTQETFSLTDEIPLLIFFVTSTVHENIRGERDQIDEIWDHIGEFIAQGRPRPRAGQVPKASLSFFFPEIYVLYVLYTFILRTE